MYVYNCCKSKYYNNNKIPKLLIGRTFNFLQQSSHCRKIIYKLYCSTKKKKKTNNRKFNTIF